MKSYLALAWKELKAQKITAVLILIAVITSTIMTTVIGQSIGILQSMRVQQAAGLNGNRYVTFHQLGREQTQKLHEDDRLYDVGDIIFVGSTTLGNSSLTLYLREYHDNALAMYPAISEIKEGRLPEKASEIALSEDSLRYLGLDAAVGDTVSLDMRVSVMDGSLPEFEYCGKFILTGILESSYIGYSTGTVEGIVGNGTAEKLLPEEYLLYSTDFKTHDKKNFQSIVYDLAKNLDVEDRYIQYNWILLDAVGISYDETSNSDAGAGFSFMTVACVLVGLLVLFAAGLVIYGLLEIYAPNLSDQDKQALNNGTGCLVKNPIPFSYGDTPVEHTELSIGDTIQLGSRALRVIGIIDTPITINNEGFTNGVQLIVNEEIYCSLMQDDTYSEIYLTLQDGVDTNSFESILDDWCSKYPGAHWLSYLESSNEMAESFEQIKMLCWVLIIFIGIIGILNIINTVYSNIHTRVNEIGMQRAIGMSAASLYKTFLWEGAYYAIFASVIGAVLGYVCCIFVGAAKTDALQLVAVPVIAIIEAAVVSVAACLLATAIPLHSIAKMNIVETIENIE